jgi:tetratricopeptide (TPR) repeat protein
LQIRQRNGKNSLNDQRAIAIIYSNIASNFFHIDITDSAYYYINECIRLLNKNNYEFEVTEAYLKLSSFYKADNKIDSSMKYILKAIDIAKRLGLRNNLKNYLSYYANLLYKKGEYQKAYDQLNEHSLLSDTIHSQESRKKIAELQAQYDNESYLREIDKLEFTAKKEKLQKIIYTSSFVAILVIISGLLILVLIKKKRDKIISHQKEELLQKEKELAQIQQKETNK